MDVIKSVALARNKWRIFALCSLLLVLTLGLHGPVLTVKGLVVNTGLSVVNASVSVDAGRIAFMNSLTTVTVYDVASGSSTSFSTPTSASYQPVIFGDKVIIAGNFTDLLSPSTIYYCILPHATPLQSCGPWEVAAKGWGLSYFAAWGFPLVRGDLIVWVSSGGFSFWRFSSETTTFVATPTQAVWPSTNGQIIDFLAKPTATSPSYTVMYYDTSNPGQGIVNTNLPARSYADAISQNTIAFNDNSTSPNRIRYYDILSNTASTAGAGPLGNLTAYGFSGIWTDRIVFSASEASLNFDCNGDSTISSASQCLQYWNIRGPSYVATLLTPSAAPPLGGAVAIYDKTLAFQGQDGHIQYVTVPMKGDVNLDGKVDSTDKSIVTSCNGQVLKGTIC